jgi:regulator of sigma E protease
VKVEAFSFGFGPRLFGFRRGETDYRFSLLPIGGYVKMAGELAGDGNPASGNVYVDDPRSLPAKPRWQRLIIAFAGPFMNIVPAVAVLAGLYMVKFQKIADSDLQAIVGHVMPDSPAAKAGIQDGDRIVGLEGKKNPTWEDVGLKEVTSAYREMHITVERNGKRFDTVVRPVLNERIGVGFAGWDERGTIQLGQVEPGYPADKAGLRKGDILVSVNGEPMHSQIKFQEITKNSNGRPIQIEFLRAGEPHQVEVTPILAKLDGPPRYMIEAQQIKGLFQSWKALTNNE